MTTAPPPKPGGGDGLTFHLSPELTERDAGPFAPPTALVRLGGEGPVHRVTDRGGGPVWLVTGHEWSRALLADARLSSDRFRSPPRTCRRWARSH